MKMIRPVAVNDGTFTRASTATFVNSAGLIETAAVDTLRINYNPVTLANQGALIEAAATNLLTYSQQFDSAPWIGSGLTATPNTDVAPDGTTTADTLTDDNAAGFEALLRPSIAPAATNQAFCFSIYVKKDGIGRAVRAPLFRLIFFDPGYNYVEFPFDTSTGEFLFYPAGAVTLNASGVINAGSYWRIWFSAQCTSATVTATGLEIYPAVTNSATWNYTVAATGSVVVWGAQLEVGTKPTSYIPTVASTVTRAADVIGGTGGLFVASTVPENDYAPWNSGATYALGDFVIVTAAGVHNIYRSAQAANTNRDPTTQPTWWVLVSKTNRWRMFDGSTGTQTSAANSFSVVLLPNAPLTSVAFLNVVAANIVVTMTDPVDGLVYNKTIYTAQTSLEGDWDSYFFDYVTAKTDVVLNDLPNYAGATLTVTFNNGASTASCGVFVMGRSIALGMAQAGARFGIVDYSVKTVDSFGGYTVVKRSFSKRASYELVIDASIIDSVATLLTEFRATPAVYIGSEKYQGTFIYGFWKDWDVNIAYPSHSLCSLTIEGLS